MRASNKLGLLLRGAYGGAAVLFYFLGIAHLPVGIATLLNYTRARCSRRSTRPLFLGEAITPATLGALALTSVGVVLVIAGDGARRFARARPLAAGRRPVGDAVGRRGRDHPRGAQDRRLVGDLRGVLRGGRRDRAVPAVRGWVAPAARRVG